MVQLLHAWDRAWAWLAGRRQEPTPPSFVSAYDEVYARLDPADLRGEEDAQRLDDLLFRADGRTQDILGYYSEDGVRRAFEAYGFFDELRKRGFDPRFSSSASDEDQHRLRIHDGPATKDNLLVELVVWMETVTLPDGFTGRFVLVNWLQMQDPRAAFPPGRPPLPDQEHPGLGLFMEFSYLLKLTVDRIGCDGLVNHPAHPHNGVLYGKYCHFVDPEVEGRFRALERDVDTRDLATLTDDIEAGRVVHRDGRPFVWQPAAQVLPVSLGARRWFRSRTYRRTVASVRERTQLHTGVLEATA